MWQHANDCDIWVPAPGPYGGTGTSHSLKKGAGSGNAHGGIYQVLTVVPGAIYQVSGVWSGGATGNEDDNVSWW